MFKFLDREEYENDLYYVRKLPDDAKIILVERGVEDDLVTIFVLFEGSDGVIYEMYESACSCCGLYGDAIPEPYTLDYRVYDREVRKYIEDRQKPQIDPLDDLMYALNAYPKATLFQIDLSGNITIT